MYTFTCRGHIGIKALHATQLAFTKGAHLTAGDHIAGIKATFEPEKVQLLAKGKSTVNVHVSVDGTKDTFTATINPSYRHPEEMIFRTGEFTSDRILGIKATKGAKQLSKELTTALANPEAVIVVGLAFL
ncbi:MAG TPA: DUF371 domain-containing protein [Candidatus Binatia bacterium]|nr:DUF371 domain-containing protein [Candidatus Binatia bacterium]